MFQVNSKYILLSIHSQIIHTLLSTYYGHSKITHTLFSTLPQIDYPQIIHISFHTFTDFFLTQVDYSKVGIFSHAGFLSRMLATLYDLEVIEEDAVKDWKSPPDNRHGFLMAARDAFTSNQRIEAVKQVCTHARTHARTTCLFLHVE
jgi:hypothetical protein